MDIVMGYATFRDAEEAEKICRELVESNLIACANIFQPHTAIYNWKDAVQTTSEVAVTFKTNADTVPDVIDLINSEHSYDVPCVVTWKIDDGNGEFLEWIQKQTL